MNAPNTSQVDHDALDDYAVVAVADRMEPWTARGLCGRGSGPVNAEGFDVRAMLRAAYDAAPVDDADRSDSDEIVGREVLVESPAPWPRDARNDVSVRLPLRVTVSTEGVELEIGPYGFEAADVEMLRRAIAEYDRIAHPPVRQSPQSLYERLMAYDSRPTGEGNE